MHGAMDDLHQRFFARMSHELRTPLNVILCYADLLGESVLGELNAQQQDAVGRLRAAGRRLRDLIDDALDMGEVELGVFEPEMRPTDLGAIARDVTRVLREVVGPDAVKLVVADQVPTVETDAGRVRRILLNLCAHCLNLPGGGGVEVRVDAVPAGAALDISASPPATRTAAARAPHAHAAVDGTLQGLQLGAGFELELAGRLVELLGGRLTASEPSDPDRSFTLRLPEAVASPSG